MDGLRDFVTMHREALKEVLDFPRERFTREEAIEEMQKTLDMDRCFAGLVVNIIGRKHTSCS